MRIWLMNGGQCPPYGFAELVSKLKPKTKPDCREAYQLMLLTLVPFEVAEERAICEGFSARMFEDIAF